MPDFFEKPVALRIFFMGCHFFSCACLSDMPPPAVAPIEPVRGPLAVVAALFELCVREGVECVLVGDALYVVLPPSPDERSA